VTEDAVEKLHLIALAAKLSFVLVSLNGMPHRPHNSFWRCFSLDEVILRAGLDSLNRGSVIVQAG